MKKTFMLFVLLTFTGVVYGQMSKGNFWISSSVRNNITHAYIGGAEVYLLDSLQNVIDSTTTNYDKYWDGYQERISSTFNFKIKSPGIYYVRARYKGYDDATIKVDLTKTYKREMTRKIPFIDLQKTIKKDLEGVTVTATKLKFYNRGDTLVYNADAFNLSEGSMLDALIRQLPGAELKDNGQIYVNGKFVNSLMLNGKDFFRGNNQVMLENLPTYMVQNIKVYDKLGILSQQAGHDIGDSELVMDVSLKKQYRVGGIGNVEEGLGTADLWLSRLFAMRFTDHSRLSFFGNMNNVNDSRTPGQNSDWNPDKTPTGRVRTKKAGADYQINDRNDKFDLNGNVTFTHVYNNTETLTNRTNFLSGGNTFDRVQDNTKYKNWEVRTNHRWRINLNKDGMSSIELMPRFNYGRHDNNGSYSSATSQNEWGTFSKETLDSLYSPTLSASLRSRLLNRSIQLSRKKGYEWSGAMDFYGNIQIKNTPDLIYYNGWFAWNGAGEKVFNRSQTDYLSSGTGTADFRNQYSKTQPGRGYDHKVSAKYERMTGKVRGGGSFFSSYGYGFRKRYEMKSKNLFRLDYLEGWGADGTYHFGDLPSETEYRQAQDMNNSYASRLYEDIHEFSFMMDYQKELKKYRLWTRINGGPFYLERQTLKYQRAQTDTTIRRTTFMPSIEWFFIKLTSKDNKEIIMLDYSLKPKTADMNYRVNYRDDSDPLNINTGNADLKDIYTHRVGLSYKKNNPEKQTWFAPRIDFNYIQNAVAMGYVYDKQTGRKTTTPANVNGNWNATARIDFACPLDKKKLLFFTNYTSAGFIHNVDLTGVEGVSNALRSTVKTLDLTETLKFDYKIGKNTLTAKGTFSWLRSTSGLDAFETINAFNYNYGLIANIKLPWKFELGTDITMYSRRGYEDSAMNSDDLVWNARLSYPLMKGKLRLMVDGFDIFHQLSNIQRYINAQGRTEVRTNVIPRYVMLHAVYRLNIMPKKK